MDILGRIFAYINCGNKENKLNKNKLNKLEIILTSFY